MRNTGLHRYVARFGLSGSSGNEVLAACPSVEREKGHEHHSVHATLCLLSIFPFYFF